MCLHESLCTCQSTIKTKYQECRKARKLRYLQQDGKEEIIEEERKKINKEKSNYTTIPNRWFAMT